MAHTGLRVVRGPDWNYNDQDGGVGYVGTVTVPERLNNCVIPDNTVFVTWDCGTVANYRIGLNKAYDLIVFDNSTKNVQHLFVTCDNCQQHGIIGMRWKCQLCDDFDLCSTCYMNDNHDVSHAFWRIDTPLSFRVDVPARISCRKVEAKGIFEGAKVIRGPDWQWENQDGGTGGEGVVTKASGKDEYFWKNVIDVKWKLENSNRYRLGHEGKVDVQCVVEASGGYFYYDHLPKLGQYAPSPNGLCVGDKVKVNVDAKSFEDLHKDDGLWNPAMVQFIGQMGTVVGLRNVSDIMIYFGFCKQMCTIKAKALEKIVIFKPGDVVEIINNCEKLEELQQNHGGWVSEMKDAVGKRGKVIHVHPTGDVRVIVNGSPWTLNPDCCTLAKDQKLGDDSNEDDAAEGLPDLFGTILESVLERNSKAFDPSNIVHQCERGDMEAVGRLIALQPEQVNEMKSGKRVLQAASFKGHLDVVNLLLDVGADINLADENGETALHVSALGNRLEVMKRLINAGADINCVNTKKHSALQIAANLGHRQCVELLLQNDCDVNLMDEDGDTALQDAIYKGRDDVVDLLLGCPRVDLSLRNRKTFTSLHLAVFKGNLYATKKLMSVAHHLVNEQTEEGHSALHIAAVNGYRDIARILIEQDNCILDMLNNRHHTPLMLAVSEGRSAVIELLVSKGARVDIQDSQGCTCLHLALGDHETLDFSSFPMLTKTQPRDLAQAPSIAKICLELPVSMENRGWIGIACFLVQHGSDINIADMKGSTPLSIARKNPLVAEVLEKHARQFERTSLPECMMCSECPAIIIFQPCGHKIVCLECSIRMKKCFLCHLAISEKITDALVKKSSDHLLEEYAGIPQSKCQINIDKSQVKDTEANRIERVASSVDSYRLPESSFEVDSDRLTKEREIASSASLRDALRTSPRTGSSLEGQAKRDASEIQAQAAGSNQSHSTPQHQGKKTLSQAKPSSKDCTVS